MSILLSYERKSDNRQERDDVLPPAGYLLGAIRRSLDEVAGYAFRLPPSLFELRRTGRSSSYGGQVG
jgi:hypothetical protein